MSDLAPVIARIDADLDAAVERLRDVLRIPSISTDPAYKDETRRAGQWMVDQLKDIGFDVTLHDTPGHPMVVGHHPGPDGYKGPRVLYYGHYDVQPPDPLELWESGPFDPILVEAEHGPRVVARGAVDDKGQVMTWIEAMRAWKAVHGSLPIAITVLLEGEEESGSPSLIPFLEANKELLKADFCLVTDTGSWDIVTPAITTRLRGMVGCEIRLHGPNRDLHSGIYGGAVLNPVTALAKVVAQLHDDYGRVTIPGFYDDVVDLTSEERAEWEALGYRNDLFLESIGLSKSVGEIGYSPMERVWARPTCELNGIYGGYTGAGTKTVIGAHATAKITCRLVANQDPAKIRAGIEQFLNERTPPDGRWEITMGKGSRAIHVGPDSAYVRAAARGLTDVYAKDPVMMGMGGSIPVVGMIQDILGFDSVLVGFGLEDDKVHSPNEKFEIKAFHNGMKSHAAIMGRIAELNA